MRVTLISQLEELERLAPAWRGLAERQLFVSPDWLLPWWRHVGSRQADSQLAVLAVFDDRDQLAGLTPWYLQRSRLHGRTFQFLGSGSVCSDYQSIVCRSHSANAIIAVLARWLVESGPSRGLPWNLLSLAAVHAGDANTSDLRHALQQHGAIVSSMPAGNCWRLELPATWEEYLARLAKSNRKRARRIQRDWLQTGRAQLRHATTHDERISALKLLVELHTRRWRTRGQQGIFAEPGIYEFHDEASRRFLDSGHLRLYWLEIDGQPVAVEYGLCDGETFYCYQSGIEPALIAQEPGVMIQLATVLDLLSSDVRAIDFLRGDEPYKKEWRATPRPIHDLRILPGNLPSYVRHSLWQAAVSTKALLRAGRNALLPTS